MLGKVVIFAPQFRAEAIIHIMEVGVGAFIYISVYMTLWFLVDVSELRNFLNRLNTDQSSVECYVDML